MVEWLREQSEAAEDEVKVSVLRHKLLSFSLGLLEHRFSPSFSPVAIETGTRQENTASGGYSPDSPCDGERSSASL